MIWPKPNSTPRISPRQARTTRPSETAPTPRAMKTVEKPSTKPTQARITRCRRRPSLSPSCISSTVMPEISER